jgi:hypothetical protein
VSDVLDVVETAVAAAAGAAVASGEDKVEAAAGVVLCWAAVEDDELPDDELDRVED